MKIHENYNTNDYKLKMISRSRKCTYSNMK